MSIATGLVDDIYFVRWIQPALEDIERILGEARRANHDLGRPIRYVAIIGSGVEPPPEDVRLAMRTSVEALLDHCRSVHLVIEGKGLRRAMARSIGTSIMLLSRNRGRTFAHSSVEEALERIGYESASLRTEILRRAEASDLLNQAPTA